MRPMVYATFLACMVLSLPLRAQGAEESLRARFAGETFVDGKAAVGLRLAAMKTGLSRGILLDFLASDDPWDAAGAFPGLFSLADPAVDSVLARRYLEFPAMRSFVSATVAEKGERFLPHFRKAFEEDGEGRWRADILLAVALGSGTKVEEFLFSIMDDTASEWRDEAFRAYSSKRRPGDAARVRALLGDPKLGDQAAARLAVIGGAQDLSYFLSLFTADRRPQARLPAITAISAWGSASNKAAAFAQALSSEEPAVIEAACAAFAGTRSPELLSRAGKAAGAYRMPFAVLAAGIYLAGYGSEEAIALAVPAFKAEYATESSTAGFGEWLAHLMTLGMSTMLQNLERERSVREFQKRKEELAKLLSSLAGKGIAAEYDDWEAWCLSRGLCVGGRNILQDLLSADALQRSEAARDAVRLLGADTEAAYAAAHPDYRGSDDFGKALILIGALKEAGYPKGWR